MADELFTTEDVMRELGVSRSRVYALIQDGRLVPARRFGRTFVFTRGAVEAARAARKPPHGQRKADALPASVERRERRERERGRKGGGTT